MRIHIKIIDNTAYALYTCSLPYLSTLKYKYCNTYSDFPKKLINCALDDENTFMGPCTGECSVYDFDNMMAPRLEYYLHESYEPDFADTVYRDVLKLMLEAQDMIVDENPDPCSDDLFMTFDCSKACATSYEDAVLKTMGYIKDKFGRCNRYHRKTGPMMTGILTALSIPLPGRKFLTPRLSDKSEFKIRV